MLKLIVFVEIVFGFFVFVRISNQMKKKNLIDERAMTKIVAAFPCWLLVWALVPGISVSTFSLVLWIPLLILAILPFFLRNSRKKRFNSEILVWLSRALVKMRIGVSFRDALRSSTVEISEYSRVKIEKMIDDLTLDRQKPQFHDDSKVEELLFYLRLADRDGRNSILRLNELREKLKMEQVFEKRVKLALQQVTAQAWVLSILYCALLAFVVMKFGWKENARAIGFSVILFIVGVATTWRMGAGFRWKV